MKLDSRFESNSRLNRYIPNPIHSLMENNTLRMDDYLNDPSGNHTFDRPIKPDLVDLADTTDINAQLMSEMRRRLLHIQVQCNQ